MTILHIVVSTIGGYAREDAAQPFVVGAFTNQGVADAVRRVSGVHATVKAVEVDHIPEGLRQTMQALGIKIPETPRMRAPRPVNRRKLKAIAARCCDHSTTDALDKAIARGPVKASAVKRIAARCCDVDTVDALDALSYPTL